MPPSYAFTMVAKGRPNVVLSDCEIGPASGTPGESHTFTAIWDTGATNSSITKEVVTRCGLKPIGRARVSHAGIDDEPDETDAYIVDIGLPNRVLVKDVRVSRLSFEGGDVLIGMDIINTGDLAITHADHGTKFTFQIPPQADIDFVQGQPSPPPRNREERRAKGRRKKR